MHLDREEVRAMPIVGVSLSSSACSFNLHIHCPFTRAQHKGCRSKAGLRKHVTKAAVNESALDLVANKTFKCTECGKCCTGAGEVWASEAECIAIADYLNVDLETFTTLYCKSFDRIVGWRPLKYKAGPDKVACCEHSQHAQHGLIKRDSFHIYRTVYF